MNTHCEKMKIAQFIGSMDSGGAESNVINLTQYLLDLNYDTQVICRTNSWVADRCLELKVPFITLSRNLEHFWKPLYGIPEYTRLLKSFLREQEIDVLHSHLYKAIIQNALACYMGGIAHVGTMHDSYTITDKPNRARWLKIASIFKTKLTAVSDSVKKDCNMSEGSIVIPNGVKRVNLTEDDRNEIRDDLEIPKDAFVVIAVSRLIPLKRIDYLINAIDKAIETDKSLNIYLIIAGDGPECGDLYEQVNNLQLTNYIKFIGFSKEVPRLLNASDLFVNCSTTEGLSYSIIEAMFAKLPIIATDVGGTEHLVRSGCNGLLIPLADEIDILSNAILELVNLPKERLAHLGQGSLDLASIYYSLEEMGDRYLSLYKRLFFENFKFHG